MKRNAALGIALLISVLCLGVIYVFIQNFPINFAPDYVTRGDVDNADCFSDSRNFEPEIREKCLDYCKNNYDGEERQSCEDFVNSQNSYASCQPNSECLARHNSTPGYNPDDFGECKVVKKSTGEWGLPQCNHEVCKKRGLICDCLPASS